MYGIPLPGVDDGSVRVVSLHSKATHLIKINRLQFILCYCLLKLLGISHDGVLDYILDVLNFAVLHVFFEEFDFFISVLDGFFNPLFDDRLVLRQLFQTIYKLHSLGLHFISLSFYHVFKDEFAKTTLIALRKYFKFLNVNIISADIPIESELIFCECFEPVYHVDYEHTSVRLVRQLFTYHL